MWKILLNHLEIVERLKKRNYYVEILIRTGNVAPLSTHIIFLFELDFNVEFPLLRLSKWLKNIIPSFKFKLIFFIEA